MKPDAEERLEGGIAGPSVPDRRVERLRDLPQGRDEVVPIDVELIAAFVDGKLDRTGRRDVIRMLAASEAAYQVYVETLALVREDVFESPQEGGGEGDSSAAQVVSIESKLRRRRVLMGLAAAAVVAWLALGPLPVWRNVGPAGGLSAVSLVASLDPNALAAAAPVVVETSPLPVFRGAGTPGTDAGRSFRLGVKVLDVEAFVASSRPADVRRAIAEILDLLTDLGAPAPILTQFRLLEQDMRSGLESADASRVSADQSLAAGLAAIAPSLERRYAFGKGAEAARLAALAGDHAFLRSERGRAYLSLVDELDLSDSTQESIRQIDALVAGDLGSSDMQRMLTVLGAVMSFASN